MKQESRFWQARIRQSRRLVQLVWLLSQGRRVTVRDLTERFRMSRRTAYRDLQLLRDSGLNVQYCESQETIRVLSFDEV